MVGTKVFHRPRGTNAPPSPRNGSVPRNSITNAAESAVAMVATLILLALFRLVLETVVRGATEFGQTPVGKVVLRRPLLACLLASLVGSVLSIVDLPIPAILEIAVRIASVLTCSLIMVAAGGPALDVITDPDSPPKGWARRLIRDFYRKFGRHELDGAWLEVLVVVALLIAPPLTALLASRGLHPDTVFFFGVSLWVLRKPIVDFEHGDSHYGFFRTRPGVEPVGKWLFGIIDWISKYPLALATARIPRWYSVQHVAVHHAEDNGLEDNQSTAPYDRASFAGFAVCAQRFSLSGMFPADVVWYLVRKHRMKALRQLGVGYAIYVVWIIFLAAYSPIVAVSLITIRYVGLVADTASFFQEHGLVDPEHPERVVTNSLHYISSANVHGSRGEDLHVEHHLRPGLHWSNYPGAMAGRLAEYEAMQAIGFCDGPGQLRAYFRCLWRRDFLALAKDIRVFGAREMDLGAREQLLRSRTAAVGSKGPGVAPRWFSAPMERLAAYLI